MGAGQGVGHPRRTCPRGGAGIRRRASSEQLKASARKSADECARYLVNKAAYLDYPTALTKGWPIATGIIEGACRHIVKDRMDLTGARWSLDAPKPCSNYASSEATATLRTTGAFTSHKSTSAFTDPATPTTSSPWLRESLQESCTQLILRNVSVEDFHGQLSLLALPLLLPPRACHRGTRARDLTYR
jgi:hypothetical protein